MWEDHTRGLVHGAFLGTSVLYLSDVTKPLKLVVYFDTIGGQKLKCAAAAKVTSVVSDSATP